MSVHPPFVRPRRVPRRCPRR